MDVAAATSDGSVAALNPETGAKVVALWPLRRGDQLKVETFTLTPTAVRGAMRAVYCGNREPIDGPVA